MHFFKTHLRPAAELKRVKVYFGVGNNDDNGFEQGGQQLHQLLDSCGICNEIHIHFGRHEPQFDTRHFGELAQFQWKAIGN